MRVAGVSCAVLPRGDGEARTYRLWVDYSLAPYLWTTDRRCGMIGRCMVGSLP